MLDANKIYDELHNDLVDLERDRKRYYANVKPFQYFLWFMLWILGPFLILRYNISSMENLFFAEEQWAQVWVIYGSVSLLSLVAFLIAHYRNIRKFKKLFTDRVVPKIISGLGEGFTYSYEGEIGRDTLEDSLLFDDFHRYGSQDLVSGTIDGIPIRFAEVTLLKVVKSQGRNDTRKIFSGIFFETELEVSFPTGIWLVGPKHRSTPKTEGKQPVKLDHPDFKRYRAFADDPEKAKQILQGLVLEKIAALNRRLGKEKKLTFGHIGYHFEERKVQIAIPTYRKFMEPRLSRSMLDPSFIEEQVVLLNEISGLMRELTLA